MQSITTIQELLAQRGLSPRHSLGQNFLHDANQVRKLVHASGAAPGTRVLEVGPGTGALTEALIDAGATVVACEIDPGLAGLIRDRFNDKVVLYEGDCLQGKHVLSPGLLQAIGDDSFMLVSNLPYQVATPLMLNLLEQVPACGSMHVTIQKEVADRLLAVPATPDWGPLGILAQALSEVRLIGVVGPRCFWPVPKVDSAMVSLVRRNDPLVDDPASFGAFVGELFRGRRKQLGRLLGRSEGLPEDIESTQRPGELTLDQLVQLHQLTR
ncbi:MAG: ribosomal RNA small subunit methyltransferase A [Phycisphaerae bacterium]|nr:ribosomal RNA small subunit methyltransferase A [Phycisphaerae bacterium]